jgi:hypothetical protein
MTLIVNVEKSCAVEQYEEESKDECSLKDWLCQKIRQQRLIPTDIFSDLFAFFDAKDLVNAASVSRYWHVLSLKDQYWRSICLQTLQLKPDSFHPMPSSR